MQFPDGETIEGSWTIPDFSNYIGGYDLRGKTVLDVGTASGFIAFNSERCGAIVTGLDARSAREFKNVPFANELGYQDRVNSLKQQTEMNLIPIKNSWWYAWHKFNSKADCIYAPHDELYEWDRWFDVVIAGAIIEHLSDPVYSIGAWARIAREAVIIPWTAVIDTTDLLMSPTHQWTDSKLYYAWWMLSDGLWRRIFDNIGFDVKYMTSNARHNDDPGGARDYQQSTIIATRRRA